MKEISLFLTIIVFPIKSWKDIKAITLRSEYNKVKWDVNSEQYSNVTSEIYSLLSDDEKSLNGTCSSIKWNDPNSLTGSGVRIWDYDCIINYSYGNIFKEDNLQFFFGFLFVSFISLIILRYFLIAGKKTTKWVEENSNKEI